MRVRRPGAKEDDYIAVSTFSVTDYKCGLRSGDKLCLRQDLPIKDENGQRDRVVPGGSIWTVLTGAIEDPSCVWLQEPDGEVHAWDDDQSIFETFERIEIL